MENLKERIDRIRKSALDLFRNTDELLFRERVEREQRLKSQYKARELYELLQNIDDAYNPETNHSCVACFSLRDEWIEVSNYGRPFSIDALIRLCQGAVSNKQGEFIGCKGIGFRSVLNWADIVEIYSGHGKDCISVRFSEEYASSQLNAISDNPHIRSQMEELDYRGIKPEFPILKAPEYVYPIKKEHDTVIRLHLKDNAVREQILEDIRFFDRSVLLFMPHLTQVYFHVDGLPRKFIRKTCNGNVVSIMESGHEDVTERFLYRAELTSLDFDYKNARKVSLAVAIPLEDNGCKTYPLYSFFPIKDQCSPLPALLHATFCLTDNRNELDIASEPERKVNKVVFEKLLRLYVRVICDTTSKGSRLEMLLPLNFQSEDFHFGGKISNLACENTYKALCEEFPVFYTVNDKYISSIDNPVFLPSCPQNFKDDAFGRIVLYNDNDRILRFSNWICNRLHTNGRQEHEQYLFEAINSVSEKWSVSERVATFKWWNNRTGYTRLPKLLKKIKNNNEEFITLQTDPCFLSGNIKNLPEWAKITILAQGDEEELIAQYAREIEESRNNGEQDDSPKRLLSRMIRKELFKLQEQSSRRVLISPVNNSVNNIYERAVEFVKWLFDIWNNAKFDSSLVRDIHFNLPSLKKTVVPAQNLYFGKDYGNVLGEKIFSAIPGYEAIDSLDFFDDKIHEREALKEMLKSVGVSTFPRLAVRTATIEPGSSSGLIAAYINDLLTRIPVSDPVKFFNVQLNEIPNLDTILSRLDTITILKWLDQESRLVEDCYEPEGSNIDYKPNKRGQQYTVPYLFKGQLPSYIRFVIASTPWIKISGKRYKPSAIICASDNISDEFLNKLGWPAITDSFISEMVAAVGCSSKRLKTLLVASGVKESLLQLSSKDFYDILLRISELSDDTLIKESYKFSRRLYREIINNGRNLPDKIVDFFLPSENQRKFFERGKVLSVNYYGEISYQPVKSVYFTNSAVLNITHEYFIKIPPRSGQKEDFKDIFNISPYTQKYIVEEWSRSDSDVSFQKAFREFLPYLMAFRLKDLSEVSKLKINLVSKAKVTCDNKYYNQFEPYTVFEKSRSHWLILVEGNTDYAQLNPMRVSDCLGEIFNVFFNFPSRDFLNKIGQFFLSDKTQRDYYIKSELGSLDEYEDACRRLYQNSEICDKIKKGILERQPNFKDFQLVECINWIEPSSPFFQQKIAELLNASGLSLAELGGMADRPLSLAEYNISCVKEVYNRYFEIFQQVIYHQFLNDKIHRELFIDKCRLFVIPKLKKQDADRLDFDAEVFVREEMNSVLKLLGINYVKSATSYYDLEIIYNHNLSNLQKIGRSNGFEYIDDFLNDQKNRSLMYFDDFVAINNEFTEFLKNKPKKNSAYFTESSNLSEFVNNVKVDSMLKAGALPEKPHHRSATVSVKDKENIEKHNRRQGDVAEYLVIIKLIERELSEVTSFLGNDYEIHWISGASKRIIMEKPYENGCKRSESDDSLGYDIEVISKDKQKRLYLEVKSSTQTECAFIMSQNEYEMALETIKNPECQKYRIVFISNLHLNNPKMETKLSYINYDINDSHFRMKVKDCYVSFGDE